MAGWTYELLYESGGRNDQGFIRVGDLVFYSGGYVELGGVMFPPGVAIDVVHGAIHLQRLAGSTQLKAVAGLEVHVFEFRTVWLWCVRWYRYKPVSTSPAGDIDANDLPSLPRQVRLKEMVVSGLVAAAMLYFLWCLILAASEGSR